MKYILLAMLFISNAFAVDFKIMNPCEDYAEFEVIASSKYSNVGELTLQVLKSHNVPFKGTEQGLQSIYNSPVGDAALEVISDFEMRAYGWCFTVNGKSPEVYANEIPLTKVKEITWFYGYAHYLRGKWIGQCIPSNTVKPDFLCKKK